MPILGKVLFSVFGRQVTVKHLLLGLAGIALAVALFFAFRFINGYFQHIKDIENQNAQLQQQVGTLQQQKQTVIQVNHDNDKVATTNSQIQQANQDIATNERHASQTRTEHYKEISHDIQNAPASTAPVSPVITNTLDSLWGEPAPQVNK